MLDCPLWFHNDMVLKYHEKMGVKKGRKNPTFQNIQYFFET